jgi:hypothetical protein
VLPRSAESVVNQFKSKKIGGTFLSMLFRLLLAQKNKSNSHYNISEYKFNYLFVRKIAKIPCSLLTYLICMKLVTSHNIIIEM